MGEPIRVRVRDCPTGLHNGEGDWVLLAPTLSLAGGLAAERDLREVSTMPESERNDVLQARWLETFVRYGAKGWNLHTADDEDIPFDPQELLDDYTLAQPVADKAADLYTESVLVPFQKRLERLSSIGRTNGTTSRRQPRSQKSSAPSSPGTTADSQPSTP